MKKLVLLMMALICVQAAAFAVPDSVTTGPFKISFDLGVPKTNYTIPVTDPVTKESLSGSVTTTYQFKIQNKIGMTNAATFILLYDPNNAVLPTESEEKLLMDTSMHSLDGVSNIQSDTRKVDGTYGGIASYDLATLSGNIKLYSLNYYPASEGGHLLVSVASGYPWNGETLQLFRTLHIERTATDNAANVPKSYVSPTSAYAGSGQGAKTGVEDKNTFNSVSPDAFPQSREVPATQTGNGPFVGSSKSDKYHYTGCRAAQRIKSENLVTFSNSAEARAAGYTPCEICNPP